MHPVRTIGVILLLAVQLAAAMAAQEASRASTSGGITEIVLDLA